MELWLWDCLPSSESHRALPHWPWEGFFLKTHGIAPFLLEKPHDEHWTKFLLVVALHRGGQVGEQKVTLHL